MLTQLRIVGLERFTVNSWKTSALVCNLNYHNNLDVNRGPFIRRSLNKPL